MFLRIITTKTKALFFFFLSLIRRALCCFRRRRRPSGDGEPLTHVGVVSSSARTPNEPPQEWTDWNVSFNESKPNTVQDHIEMYRKQLAAARQAQEEKPEEQRDLFGDMAPKITKQKKVFVDKSQSEGINSNRLSLAPDELGVTIRVSNKSKLFMFPVNNYGFRRANWVNGTKILVGKVKRWIGQ